MRILSEIAYSHEAFHPLGVSGAPIGAQRGAEMGAEMPPEIVSAPRERVRGQKSAKTKG